MEAAHRAALLAASCLRTPLDPRTRAPAALYERGPPPAAAQVLPRPRGVEGSDPGPNGRWTLRVAGQAGDATGLSLALAHRCRKTRQMDRRQRRSLNELGDEPRRLGSGCPRRRLGWVSAGRELNRRLTHAVPEQIRERWAMGPVGRAGTAFSICLFDGVIHTLLGHYTTQEVR